MGRLSLSFRFATFAACTVAIAASWRGASLALAHPPTAAVPYRVELTDEHGVPLRTFGHHGRDWALGQSGQKYRIRVHNLSPRRVEAVVSVDGRDALDGRPAHTTKRGYLIAPHSSVTIDGFRLSLQDVAAFRFGSVASSYAAQMGDARQVGVIGVAVFTEQQPPPPVPQAPLPVAPLPQQRCDVAGKPPCARDGQAGSRGAAAAPARSAPSAAGKAEGAQAERAGLGTDFGERQHAPVTQVSFLRASPHFAAAVLTVRYNDRSGLLAMGIDVDGAGWPQCNEEWLRTSARPFADAPRQFSTPPVGWSR